MENKQKAPSPYNSFFSLHSKRLALTERNQPLYHSSLNGNSSLTINYLDPMLALHVSLQAIYLSVLT